MLRSRESGAGNVSFQIEMNKTLQYLLCFIALTSVTSITVVIPPVYYLALGFLPIYLFMPLRYQQSSLFFLLLIIAPSIISMFSLGYLFISPDLRFIDFIYTNNFFWIGRLVNVFLMGLFFILATSFFAGHEKGAAYYQQFLKCYMWGGLFLLGTALWQIIAHYTGVVGFPFETRSHVHSAHGIELGTSLRVTGLAAEPSYLAPYMTDLIAITFMLYGWQKKSIMIASVAILVIGFSLSPTGYFIFLGAIGLAGISLFLKYRGRFSIYIWLLLTIFIPILGVMSIYLLDSRAFEYILTRLVTFTPESSSRAYMNFMVPTWLGEGESLRAFFGYGMKSYALLGEYYNLPNGIPVHITSNNLFVDTLWEAGMIGLFFISALFAYIYISIYKLTIGRGISFLLFYYFFDFLLSSLMRADFSSPRFFIFFIISFWLIKMNRGSLHRG